MTKAAKANRLLKERLPESLCNHIVVFPCLTEDFKSAFGLTTKDNIYGTVEWYVEKWLWIDNAEELAAKVVEVCESEVFLCWYIQYMLRSKPDYWKWLESMIKLDENAHRTK